MAIVIPGTAVNYPNALLAVGLNFNNQPKEGFRSLPAEIDWSTMGGASKVVGFNAQTAGGTIQLSQICATSPGAVQIFNLYSPIPRKPTPLRLMNPMHCFRCFPSRCNFM